MNRISKAAGLALFALLALSVPASAQADINGTWTLTVASPDGSSNQVTATIEQDGAEFKGQLSSELGQTPFSGGKIDGDKIEFVLEIDMQGQFIAIQVDAEVDGDEMTGEFYIAEFGAMPFTGARAD